MSGLFHTPHPSMDFWQFTPQALLPFMAALAAASAAVQVWRRRDSPQAGWLATVLFGAAWWAGIAVLEYATTALWGKIFFSQLTYLGIELAPLAVWRFAYAYTHDGAAPSRGWRWLANGWVVAVLVATFTNGWHHWLWPDVRLIDVDGFVQAWYGRGWLFWANVVYCYGAMAAAMLIFLRHALASQGVLRRQGWVLLIATLTPWVTSGMYLLRLGPWGRVDHTPVGFVAMGLILLWGLRRFQLLDLRPVASRTLFDSMGDPVLVVDARGRLVLANPAAQVQLGLASESVGRDVAEVLTARPALIAALGRRVPEETVADGATWWHLRATPLDTQGTRLFVLRDVSEQKRAELALGEALRRADASAQEAHAANAAKSIFLAQVSHDLRTPLHAILGMAELCQAPAATITPLQAAGTIQTAGESLLRLVNDLLDFSRIEGGRVELESEPFRLAPLIDSVAQLLTVMARRKGLALRVTIAPGTPAGWRGDADRIRQILLNLVGNAVKFTERGEVAVTVSALAGKLRLEVRDTGPGIPLDRQPTIFEPFNRGDLTQVRRTEGTGLGLAIVRRLAEAMGGVATVSSVPGAGWCFAVELALPVVAEGELPKLEVSTTPVANAAIALRVLLADDDALSRKVTQAQLVQCGCEVESVSDGASVLPRLAAAPFDVVVLDGQMPGLDGWEVAAKLREPAVVLAGRLPHIVALSADLTPQTLARWHGAGVPHVVAKPARLDGLASALVTPAR